MSKSHLNYYISYIKERTNKREWFLIKFLVLLLGFWLITKFLLTPVNAKIKKLQQNEFQLTQNVREYEAWLAKEDTLINKNKELKETYQEEVEILHQVPSGLAIKNFLDQQNYALIEKIYYSESYSTSIDDVNLYHLPITIAFKMPYQHLTDFEMAWHNEFHNTELKSFHINSMSDHWIQGELSFVFLTDSEIPREGYVNETKILSLDSALELEKNSDDDENDVTETTFHEQSSEYFNPTIVTGVTSNELAESENNDETETGLINLLEGLNLTCDKGTGKIVNVSENEISFYYSPDSTSIDDRLTFHIDTLVEISEQTTLAWTYDGDILFNDLKIIIQQKDGTIYHIFAEKENKSFFAEINPNTRVVGFVFTLSPGIFEGGECVIYED